MRPSRNGNAPVGPGALGEALGQERSDLSTTFRFAVVLEAEPNHGAPPSRRLARALKVLRRRFALVAVEVKRVVP